MIARGSGTILFVIVKYRHIVVQKHLGVTEQGVARGVLGSIVLFLDHGSGYMNLCMY